MTVVIVGLSAEKQNVATLFSIDEFGATIRREVETINPYLVAGQSVIVEGRSKPPIGFGVMYKGNMPSDGGFLVLESEDRAAILLENPTAEKFLRPYVGSRDFIRGEARFCLWIEDSKAAEAESLSAVSRRLERVRQFRASAKAPTTRPHAATPHKFIQIQATADKYTIIIPRHTSERREFLPFGLLNGDAIVSDAALAVYDAPIWNMAVIGSRLHLVWVSTVCGKIKTDFRYSNTLGWNAFPIPTLTAQNKADLTRCAENILLAREAHFPATIADLYDPETMPPDLRRAHDENDETLERIYIGRRFRNDTERLEKLFELYTKMTGKKAA